MTDSGWLGDPMPTAPPVERRRIGPLLRVDLLGRFASVLIVIVALASIVYSWNSWYTHGVLKDFFSFGADESTLEAADQLTMLTSWLYLAIAVATGVVFIVWLWRARQNAESISDHQHTRGRGWVIGSWICPVVNLWFPYQIVRDVWKTSNPHGEPPKDAPSVELRWVPGSKLLGCWWVCWLVAALANLASYRVYDSDPGSTPQEVLDWAKLVATLDTGATVFEIAAAVLIIVAIRQISAWQQAAATAHAG